jgi:SAM-dependent methyltransferase
MHEPVVRRYINESISGSPDCWPIDWLARFLGGRCFRRAVSLGCGEGALERDLVTKGICAHVLGVDVSLEAIELARSAAERTGATSLAYATGDLNRLALPPNSYEAAFFHQSLHHVEQLDHCLSTVATSLEPDGFLYVDEYVGPSRGMWSRELLNDASAVFDRLPRSVRRSRRLGLPVDWRDPTEAIASAEIPGALARHYVVRHRRDYGGNLLAVIYPHLDLDRLSPFERDGLLQWLVDQERLYLVGSRASFYSIVIATPIRAGRGREGEGPPKCG